MEPLIITAALTGNDVTKEKTPYAPITLDEIAEDAVRCYEAGASVVHIHVRDENGLPSQSPALYQQVIEKIRAKGCPIICQLSLAGKEKTDWSMVNVLRLNPQMTGLAAGSINRPDRLNCFEPKFIEFMAQEIVSRKIAPEMEIMDVAMIQTVKRLIKEGKLPERVKYNFGLNAMLPGNIETMVFMKNCLDPGEIWGVTAIGDKHYELTAAAIAIGGHARGGIEDCLTDENGNLTSNEAQIRWIANMAKMIGRKVATVEETKEMLGVVRN